MVETKNALSERRDREYIAEYMLYSFRAKRREWIRQARGNHINQTNAANASVSYDTEAESQWWEKERKERQERK
jgi:hypothetical protein